MNRPLSTRISDGIMALSVVAVVAYLVVLPRVNSPAKGPNSLLGRTPNDIASYAIEYARGHHEVVKDSPTALLSRPITRGQFTALGLGCLGEFAAMEEPPLELVILKGDFVFTNSASHAYALNSKYLAYVFDAWSGELVYRLASVDGSHLRLALNDLTLPAPAPGTLLPASCPTQIPSSAKKVHYGGIVPPVTGTPGEQIPPAATLTPSNGVPQPVPSSVAP